VTYVITEACIGTQDKSCVDVCPVDCIHFEEGTDRLLYINPEECIDCGACEPACPVKAIYPEDAVPEDMEPWIKVNATWYEDADAARAIVNSLKPE
jgi:NAD-dependent dihydropyrimidine dehydrogenase PreA subunit